MLVQNDLKTALGAPKNGAGNKSATICVYGYGPAKNPFYKQAKTLKAHSEGCSVILGAPVSRGEQLLLMSASGQNSVVANIVTTRALAPQMFEVELAFAAPCPNFWQPVQK